MLNKLVFASLAAVSFAAIGTASADPLPRGEIGVNARAGGAVGQLGTAASIDADVRIASTPWYAHGAIASGSFDDLSEAIGSESASAFYRGSGTFRQARLGAEYLRCSSSGHVCGAYGVDIGVLRTSDTSGPLTDTPSVHYTQEQLIPHLGLDAGGAHLRARVFAELALGATQREAASPSNMSETESLAGGQGVMVGAGLAYRF
jgi:hypothetical protein